MAGSDCVFDGLNMLPDVSVPPHVREVSYSPHLPSLSSVWDDLKLRHFPLFFPFPEKNGRQGGQSAVSQAKLCIICRLIDVNRVQAKMHLCMHLVLQSFPACPPSLKRLLSAF